jgi:hypothetical protein
MTGRLVKCINHPRVHADVASPVFPQPAGPEPARLAYQKISGREVRPEVAGDMVVRDEYLSWVIGVTPLRQARIC